MGDYKTLVLHLGRAVGRREQVQDIIRKSPYPADIIDAVDGSALSQQELAAHFAPESLMQPTYPFGLNAGEIGCFLSHRRAWQEILDSGLSGALIVEDDTFIEPETFGPAHRLAEAKLPELGYIKFDTRGQKTSGQTLCKNETAAIIRPQVVPLRTSCQLVSRAAAGSLLAATQWFDRPVDVLLQLFWETGVPIFCVVPSGVSDRTQETGGSTLSKKIPPLAKLRRELDRTRYRARIKRISNAMARERGGAKAEQ